MNFTQTEYKSYGEKFHSEMYGKAKDADIEKLEEDYWDICSGNRGKFYSSE